MFKNWVINGMTSTVNPLSITVADGEKSVTAVFRIPGTENNPPTADAGADQTVIEKQEVTLDGSGSFDPDGKISSYLWEQIGGAIVSLSNDKAVSPKFTAMEILSDTETEVLTFRLTVEDFDGATDIDTVTITVRDSGNDPPVADAGEDQTVIQRYVVTLDGSGSTDPNGVDDIASYFWEQTEGIAVALSDTTAVKPTFTAPDVFDSDQPEKLVFMLTVGDTADDTSEDYVTITVERGPIGGDSSNAGCFVGTMR